MHRLNPKPDRAELEAHMGEDCKLGRSVVRVSTLEVETRSGSYERGFKFHDTTYVMLIKGPDKTFPEYSLDHGKTWSHSKFEARKSAKRNKIKLSRTTSTEFAYDAIQSINQRYGI